MPILYVPGHIQSLNTLVNEHQIKLDYKPLPGWSFNHTAEPTAASVCYYTLYDFMPPVCYTIVRVTTLLVNGPSCQLPSFIAEQLFMRRRRVDGTPGLISDYVRVEIMMLRSASAPFCRQSYRHKRTRHLLFSLL